MTCKTAVIKFFNSEARLIMSQGYGVRHRVHSIRARKSRFSKLLSQQTEVGIELRSSRVCLCNLHIYS